MSGSVGEAFIALFEPFFVLEVKLFGSISLCRDATLKVHDLWISAPFYVPPLIFKDISPLSASTPPLTESSPVRHHHVGVVGKGWGSQQ